MYIIFLKEVILMNIDFKQYVISELERMPFYNRSSNGLQHTVKCPYCNDDSPSHGHFSIKIDIDNDDEPMLYNCLKCPASGLVTKQTLDDLGIFVDSSMASNITRVNKRYAKKNKLVDMLIEDFNIPPVINNQLTDIKLDYINNRLGINLTYSDLDRFRIVPQLSEFMVFNEITHIKGVTPQLVRFIDFNYVGFLSLNRNNIVFRKINDAVNGMRYIKVKIHDKNLDPNSYYTIPSPFDLMYTSDMNVHIAEGTFDILSIYQNVLGGNPGSNNLFYAVCGFSYSTVVKNIIRIGITTDIILHIYADNDKKDYEVMRTLQKNQSILPYINSVYFHRNSYSGKKDFGVSSDCIKETKKKVM